MTKQQWLESQIAAYPNLDKYELCSFLNTATLVDNPTPQLQVPRPITLKDVSDCCSATEGLEIYKIPNFLNDVRYACENNKIEDLTIMLGIVQPLLSPQSIANIQGLFGQTIPDPNYQSQLNLSPAELAGFDVIYVYEIEELL